jgi:CBS domain-containing protein
MMQTLEEVLKEPDAALALLPVETVEASKSIDEAMSKIKSYCPVLVTSDGTDKGKLIGILTSFDLL